MHAHTHALSHDKDLEKERECATMITKYEFDLFIGGRKRKTAVDDTLVQVELPQLPPTHDVNAYFNAQEGAIRQAVQEAMARDV